MRLYKKYLYIFILMCVFLFEFVFVGVGVSAFFCTYEHKRQTQDQLSPEFRTNVRLNVRPDFTRIFEQTFDLKLIYCFGV